MLNAKLYVRLLLPSFLLAMALGSSGFVSDRLDLPQETPISLGDVLRSMDLLSAGGADRLGEASDIVTASDAPADSHAGLTLYAAADATVVENLPEYNAGMTTDMWAGYDSCFDPSVGIVRSLVAFDVSPIPDDNGVSKATLRLRLVSSCDRAEARASIQTHRVEAGWSEAGVTWANAPTFSGRYGSQSIVHSAYQWYEFDVTPLVQGWHEGQFSNHGLLLTGSDVSGFRGFSTKEGAFRPELVVENQPVAPPTPTVTDVPSEMPTSTSTPTATRTPSPTQTAPLATWTPTSTATATPIVALAAHGAFFPQIQYAASRAEPTDTPTATATATPTPTATLGGGALFSSVLRIADDGGYANVPDNASLDLASNAGDDATIEAFFFVPANLVDDTLRDQILKKQGSYALDISFNATEDDWINFRIWTSRLNIDADIVLSYRGDLALGWHHVAAVYDNEFTVDRDRVMLYLDGRLVNDSNVGAMHIDLDPGLLDTSSDLLVGGVVSGRAGFPGYIEEVRLSNNIRYTGSAYVVPQAPFAADSFTRALWHFDESVGATRFVDASIHNNTLTGHGGAVAHTPSE